LTYVEIFDLEEFIYDELEGIGLSEE